MRWYVGAIKKYAVFSGRAHRAEYWSFALFNLLMPLMISVVGIVFPLSVDLIIALLFLYWAAALLPGSAVTVRRLHDTGRSGWWTLALFIPVLGVVLLVVLLAQRGNGDPNRYGPAVVPSPKPDQRIPIVDPGRALALGEASSRVQLKARLREAVTTTKRDEQEAQRSKEQARLKVQGARSALDMASKRLAELESGRGTQLASLSTQATLHEFWIDLPNYSGPVRGAKARVNRTGDIQQVSDVTSKTKGGLGGAVGGGLLFGPVGAIVGSNITRKTTVETKVRQVDTRQSELEVVGPGFAWSTRVSGESDALTRFRDLVNARGACTDDVSQFIQPQVNHVESLRQDLQTRSGTYGAAAESAKDALAISAGAIAEYRSAPCYFLDRLRVWMAVLGRGASAIEQARPSEGQKAD